MSDADLVQKVVTKCPQYKDNIASYSPTQFEKDRTQPAADSGFWGGVKHAAGLDAPAPSMTDAVESGIPAIGVAKTLYGAVKNAPENYKAGGLPGTLGPLVGVDPVSMRNRAEHGDTAGVLGEAAVPTAMAAAPIAAEGLGAARSGIRNAAYSGAEPKPIVKSIGDALQHPTTIPGKVIGATVKEAFPPPAE